MYSIEKGSEPWKHIEVGKKYSKFGFRCVLKSPDGKFKWDVIARSSKDGRPTIELFPRFPAKAIKIRYGPLKARDIAAK